MDRKATVQNLRRRQLDRLFAGPVKLKDVPDFKRGYIREIRDSLGLTSTQLAIRLGVSQPAVVRLENSEKQGSISLNSLKKIAEAVDCNLVYALVPKRSLEETLASQAKLAAEKLVGRVDHSMALEAQSTSKAEIQKQIDEVAGELMRNLDKRIWEIQN